ncbi:MAG: serine hydrolase, partial [Bacteroidales bacterium]|nr:serine hydrolase [Bacteroidales bacterium]
ASKKFGISAKTIEFIDEICEENNVILNLFANPYALAYFKNAEKCSAIIVSYNDWKLTNDLSAQLIFGGIPALGRLPVSADSRFLVNSGFDTEKIRLKYTSIPEEAGVDSEMLYKVDSMMNEAIQAKAFPGGQIVAARNGIVFYIKSFGYHDYSNKIKVDDFDLYDLASVTKVLGSAPALMKLYDEKQFALNDNLSKYVPVLKNTKKSEFKIFDILTHRAGFKSWEAFFKKTIKNDSVKNLIYSNRQKENYNSRVCEGFYILDSYRDTIFQEIINSPHNNYGRYVYSDMGFYLFPEMIKNLTKKTIDEYLYEEFYSQIGAWTMRYLPLEKFSKNQIAPTEEDNVFRKEQIHGYVHDQGATMLGGISGHAGLFASANDVAKIMQIFVQNGNYGNYKFINPETIDLFTKYQFDSTKNRRGLAWDKPVPGDTTKGLGSGSASNLAYGHSGYTGTMVWADPHYDFVYVFNSNRVYKDAENWKILKLNTRTIIEEIFYQAIIKKNPELRFVKN